jgi:hypothetical protein
MLSPPDVAIQSDDNIRAAAENLRIAARYWPKVSPGWHFVKRVADRV